MKIKLDFWMLNSLSFVKFVLQDGFDGDLLYLLDYYLAVVNPRLSFVLLSFKTVAALGKARNYQFFLHLRTDGKTTYTACFWNIEDNLWSSVHIQKHYDSSKANKVSEAVSIAKCLNLSFEWRSRMWWQTQINTIKIWRNFEEKMN